MKTIKNSSVKDKLSIKKIEENLNKLEDFRELKGYKIALEFYTKLYVVLNELPFYERFGVFDQLFRSSESIIANLAEGSHSLYLKTRANFYSISFATASESQSWLDVMKIKGYFDCNMELYYELDSMLEEIKKLIVAYIEKIFEDID